MLLNVLEHTAPPPPPPRSRAKAGKGSGRRNPRPEASGKDRAGNEDSELLMC